MTSESRIPFWYLMALEAYALHESSQISLTQWWMLCSCCVYSAAIFSLQPVVVVDRDTAPRSVLTDCKSQTRTDARLDWTIERQSEIHKCGCTKKRYTCIYKSSESKTYKVQSGTFNMCPKITQVTNWNRPSHWLKITLLCERSEFCISRAIEK